MAPELIQGQYYSSEIDVWAYGEVLWCMVTGEERPYAECTSIDAVFRKTQDADDFLEIPDGGACLCSCNSDGQVLSVGSLVSFCDFSARRLRRTDSELHELG